MQAESEGDVLGNAMRRGLMTCSHVCLNYTAAQRKLEKEASAVSEGEDAATEEKADAADENQNEESGSSDDDEAEGEDESDDDSDPLKIAWESLDTARAIQEKHLPESAGVNILHVLHSIACM